MMKPIIVSMLGLFFLSFSFNTDFLTEQKKFERVRTAIREKQELVETKLAENQFSLDNFHLLMIAYKDIDLLEIYARKMQETTYTMVFSYRICSRSGQLGPKRKEGDRQVPEGFYHINRFNPTSRFHLSLGLNYPNLSDKRKSIHHNLGDDIFIHGSCVTIGCLPMTDRYMEEIYLLALHAKNNGQSKIPFYIFPFKMTDENMDLYKTNYGFNPELISFWNNLKIGYDKFVMDQKELIFTVADNGDYKF